MGYPFGDGAVAAERLALLHQVFEPTSRRFLSAAAPRACGLALDLGCGPGHTTRMLAKVLRPRHTLGLDLSEDFIERAAGFTSPGVEFEVSDVAVEPLPQADVIYARYLLSHLREPEARVRQWRKALRPGGRMLIEENGTIEATDPVLVTYEELVGAAIGAGGGDLYVGRRLAGLAEELGGSVTRDELEPPVGQVARLFGLNLRTWGPRAVELGLAGESEIAALADDLTGLEDRDDRGPARWELVQVALPRD